MPKMVLNRPAKSCQSWQPNIPARCISDLTSTTLLFQLQDAIDKNQISMPENRLAFIRECVNYFEGYLACPTPEEYSAISKKICDKYPTLKSSKYTKYWVCYLGGRRERKDRWIGIDSCFWPLTSSSLPPPTHFMIFKQEEQEQRIFSHSMWGSECID